MTIKMTLICTIFVTSITPALYAQGQSDDPQAADPSTVVIYEHSEAASEMLASRRARVTDSARSASGFSESQPNDDTYTRASNVDRIFDGDGQIFEPWIRTQRCVASRCAEIVQHSETGEIAFQDGVWSDGFLPTGRGEEVLRLRRPERPARPTRPD